ncbi:MAG: hypothetical protein A2Y40_04780 [Candidatus Margulisbacteria bacterium GWF2_35_9]|nr:MAG: hypothetical protein A2Y40_04780 [Candidatus Margulisbacteria bacterium GWF2_35_9]
MQLEDESIFKKIDIFVVLMKAKCPPEKRELVYPVLAELLNQKNDLQTIKKELVNTRIFSSEGDLDILGKAQKVKDFIAYHKSVSESIRNLIEEATNYVK